MVKVLCYHTLVSPYNNFCMNFVFLINVRPYEIYLLLYLYKIPQATDADVGINARLVYWSSADALAVAPTTGLVHVRRNELLENNMVLTVQATDREGTVEGLTGSISLMVRNAITHTIHPL